MDRPIAKRTLIKAAQVVTMDDARRVLPGGGIIVEGSQIDRVLTSSELGEVSGFPGAVIDATRMTAIPGLIQTHIHLCQTIFRGLADDLALLDWLTLRIFPFEAAHNAQSIRASSLLGLAELLRSGTTTIMDMGSIHHEEEIVRAVDEAGIRAFVGKALMDLNDSYPPLKESTDDALASAASQAAAWHGSSGGRVRYAVAPRFVLSCSDRLLRGAQEIAASTPGVLFHSHAAENPLELEAVRRRCRMGNIEFFETLGLLTPATCLAHCVWISAAESGLLARHRVKVLHCPSSNLKLASGIANVPAMRMNGITVSLGADGAPCNNSLNMFQEMKLAALIQKPAHGAGAMSALSVFEMATIEGAKTLGLQHSIGSLEAGKKADIVLLNMERAWNPSAGGDLYSALVYSGGPENVRSVMVDGEWLYEGGEYRRMDEQRIVDDASRELRLLLNRARP